MPKYRYAISPLLVGLISVSTLGCSQELNIDQEIAPMLEVWGAKPLEEALGQQPELERMVETFVDTHLTTSKGWREQDYRLVARRLTATQLEVIAIHLDDLGATDPGGGRSLLFVIDLAQPKIVEELGFQ